MQRSLPPGHVAVYYPVDADALKIGDIIAYQPAENATGGIPITHRIVAVGSSAGHVTSIIVKGDANRFPDSRCSPARSQARWRTSSPTSACCVSLPSTWG